MHRIRGDIASGWANHRQDAAYNGWYGHGTEVRGNKLIVLECAGVAVHEIFSYQKLLKQEREHERQTSLTI